MYKRKVGMLSLVDRFPKLLVEKSWKKAKVLLPVTLGSKRKEKWNMEFSNKLMELRKEKGWSQEELGNKIDVSRQTVSKWELGQTTPEMNKLIEISRLFQITVDELICANSHYDGKEKSPARLQDDVHKAGSRPFHFEYTSEKKIKGIPLVHVNVGIGKCKAKGIIAIGNAATGIIAIGLAAQGLVSVAFASLGLFAFGWLSVGLAAFGTVAVGVLSFGAVAVGIVTFGGLSVGVYSMGGMAVGLRIAAGGSANAPIAIGDKAQGVITFLRSEAFTKEEVRAAILSRYPGTWDIIIRLILLAAFS